MGLLLLGAGSGSSGSQRPRLFQPAEVDAAGTSLTMVFTRPVSGFSGASGFSVSGPGNDLVISYVSGSGSIDIGTGHSGPIVFSIQHSTGSTPVQYSDVLYLSYTPGVVIGSTGDGAALKVFSTRLITNNSAQGVSSGGGFFSTLAHWLGGAGAV